MNIQLTDAGIWQADKFGRLSILMRILGTQRIRSASANPGAPASCFGTPVIPLAMLLRLLISR